MKDIHKLRALVALAHAGAAVGLWFLWDPAWLAVSFVCWFAFLNLGHDLYHHRYLSHRAFEMARPLQVFFSLLGIFSLSGTPIGIASVHARHHVHADTDVDPHPAHYPWRSMLWIYPEMDGRPHVPTVRRLMRDRWLVFVGKNYFRIYLVTAAAAAVIDLRWLVYGMLVPAAYSFVCNTVVNIACHRWGSRNFETQDNSRNNHIANALLCFSGIAMHNNHHAHPRDFVLSTRRGEIDLVGLIIGAIRSRP